jgi:hypothetical protein
MTSYVSNQNDFVLSLFVIICIQFSSRCVCLVYTGVTYLLNNVCIHIMLVIAAISLIHSLNIWMSSTRIALQTKMFKINLITPC